MPVRDPRRVDQCARLAAQCRHNNATVICCDRQEKEQPSRLFAARRNAFDV
jgi:hypothetical protein